MIAGAIALAAGSSRVNQLALAYITLFSACWYLKNEMNHIIFEF